MTGKLITLTGAIAILLLAAVVPDACLLGSAQSSIRQDVAAGRLDPDLGRVYQALAVIRPEALPAEYLSQGLEPGKSGTIAVRDGFLALLENPDLAASFRGIMEARPVREFDYESPGARFRLHYDTTGDHAVSVVDTNGNSVPDYIERAAVLADSVWHIEIEQLGYLQPPSDNTLGGGQDQYDIYFKTMLYYGYTAADLPGPAPWEDYSSFSVVSSNFETAAPNDDPEGQLIGALKVTLAHEYSHAVHYGYNGWAESYFMEMSATWMEETAFPEVNDNYQYLPQFFDEPQEGLQHDGLHPYGSFIWPKFIEERFDRDAIRSIWHECRYNNSYSAMAYVLDSLGSSFRQAFADFLGWNYFTDSRSGVGYYEDASDYPGIRVLRTHTELPDSNNYSTEPPEPLASNYIIIENPGDVHGILTFALDGDPTVSWVAVCIVDYGDDNYFDTTITSFSNGEGCIYVQRFENVERVIVSPGVVSNYGSVYNYFYDVFIRSEGDADGNHLVNISDVTFIIGYIFGGGPASHPLLAMDADCNDMVNISDAVRLVQYIFGGGPAPCE